mmetsp:Transcript_111832/g.361088  ORF Transcript_111832/g.361088 Transcript_111832/m.361088 type:complete len:217 (-) Transcript_111832:28-678(-)
MLLDDTEHGPLLRPRGLERQMRPVEPLSVAVMEDDAPHLCRCLEMRMDVNSRDVGGRTALMISAEMDRRRCAALLLEAGADFSLFADCGRDAMALAVSEHMRQLLAEARMKARTEAKGPLQVEARSQQPAVGNQEAARGTVRCFEVVSPRGLAVRRGPSRATPIVASKVFGEVVEVRVLDETGLWGLVDVRWLDESGSCGWVLFRDEQLGELLRAM